MNPGSARIRSFAAALVGAALVLAGPVGAQDEVRGEPADGRFTLHGLIVDGTSGSPLAGAAVTVDEGEWVFADDRGRFRVFGTEPGWIDLQAQQLGYVDLTFSVQVSRGDTLLVRLAPHPVEMEELTVAVDRFERRRRAYPFPVRVLERDDLLTVGAPNVLELVRQRGGMHLRPCGRGFRLCTWRRGTVFSPAVYVDEVRTPAGLGALQSYAPHQIYMVEVLNRGAQVRVYTTHFMERAGRVGLRPIPIL